jgi:diadenosine tetraphosphate (Ap4A) HIT family hydrolase
MAACDLCPTLEDPGEWREVFIHEDPLVVLAHIAPPDRSSGGVYPGHLLLLPRRHVESPGALTDEEAERIGLWLMRGSRALESELGAEHVYIARLGDGWKHLHVHLLARYPNTPAEYRGLNVRDWPGVERCGRAKTVEIVERLRRRLR